MVLARPLLVVLVAGAVSAGAIPLAYAGFAGAATATSTFSTGQLAAPTGLAVQQTCTLSLLGVVVGASLKVTWTPSSTSWVSGQRVRVVSSGGVVVYEQVVSPGTSSVTVSLSSLLTSTYTATVRAGYESWTSPAATASSAGC